MYKFSRIVISLIALILISQVLLAQPITVDQNNGPYYTIQAGVNAAFPGATVLVMPGVYTESVTINEEITLQGYDPYTTKIFSGSDAVSIRTGAGNCVIRGFDIQAGNYGIKIYNEGVTPTIEGNIIHNCNQGINDDNRVCTIKNNIVKYCVNGIWLYNEGADALIFNNVSYGNSDSGIYLDDGNYNNAPDPIVYSNIVIQNNRGIYTDGDVFGIFTYNDVWDNSSGNWVGNITQGPGNISEDPLFVDLANGNYFLQHPASPCIDTGHTGDEYLDPNGTRNDMGVYGGPDCLGGGGPGITDTEVTPISVPQGETINVEASGTVH